MPMGSQLRNARFDNHILALYLFWTSRDSDIVEPLHPLHDFNPSHSLFLFTSSSHSHSNTSPSLQPCPNPPKSTVPSAPFELSWNSSAIAGSSSLNNSNPSWLNSRRMAKHLNTLIRGMEVVMDSSSGSRVDRSFRRLRLRRRIRRALLIQDMLR
jgi:hypothetical protein